MLPLILCANMALVTSANVLYAPASIPTELYIRRREAKGTREGELPKLFGSTAFCT